MVDFQFHFDFGSPNAYLAHRVLPAIEARTGVECTYVPVLLGGVFKLTGNRSPMEQNKGVLNKGEYGRREMQRFIARHELDQFAWNPHFPVNTVLIMRGSLSAAREGVAPAYDEAVFSAMWEQGLKMDDPAIVGQVLTAAGLDAEKILAGTQDQAIKDQLLANTKASVERGNFGSPTFFVDDEMYFGKDRLRDVEEEILNRRS